MAVMEKLLSYADTKLCTEGMRGAGLLAFTANKLSITFEQKEAIVQSRDEVNVLSIIPLKILLYR